MKKIFNIQNFNQENKFIPEIKNHFPKKIMYRIEVPPSYEINN